MQNHLALPSPPRSWRTGYIIGAGVLLLLPLVAMAFTTEVVWGPEDFLAAAGLLAALWLAVELAWRVLPSAPYRATAMAVVVAAIIAVWAHLAVGVF